MKALSIIRCLLVVVELAGTWGTQQTLLEAGDEVAMVMT